MKRVTGFIVAAIFIGHMAVQPAYSQTAADPFGNAGPAKPKKVQPEPAKKDEAKGEASKAADIKAATEAEKLEPRGKTKMQPLEVKAAAGAYLTNAPAKRATGYEAQGALEVGTEAIQILGQIVVDRASAQAYDQLKKKMETLLACDKPVPGALSFPETCTLIKPLRLQDIAQSPSAFYQAIAVDGFRNVVSNLPKKEGSRIDVNALLDETMIKLIVAAIRESQNKTSPGTPETIVSEFLTRVTVDNTIIDKNDLNPGQQTVLIASAAVVLCKSYGQQPGASCNTAELVNQFAAAMGVNDPEVRTDAKTLANLLVVALTPPSIVDRDGGRKPRFHAATLALFDGACMVKSGKAKGCEDLPAEPFKTMLLSRNVALSAIDGDSNNLIKNLQEMVNNYEKNAPQDRQRALAFCGSILNYASTYTTGDGNSEEAHASRTKILESLTQDMTNRTSRDGDSIWSLGGSLRGAAGYRYRGNEKEHPFYGPISLPIGFGYQSNSGKDSFHFEASMLDLGQYVSFQEGGNVQEFKLADAIAPSITLGYAWGRQLPTFVGITAGYSPRYKFRESDTEKRGAYFGGIVFGIYVPLLDLN